MEPVSYQYLHCDPTRLGTRWGQDIAEQEHAGNHMVGHSLKTDTKNCSKYMDNTELEQILLKL